MNTPIENSHISSNDDLHIKVQRTLKQADVSLQATSLQAYTQKSVSPYLSLDIDVILPLSQGIVGIFGDSGAGKSTLLRTIAGMDTGLKKQIEYKAHWQDQRIDKLPADQNPCLLQTQQAQLFPNLTVLANLTFVIKHSSWTSSCPFSLEQVIDWCGIQHLLNQTSTSLSGGEQQRVNLARSLLCGKPIILLDEPFSALDWNTRTELLSLLVQLQQNYQLYFVIVSHSLKELALTTDNLIVIKNGKVSQIGVSEILIPKLTTTSNQTVFSKLELSAPTPLPQHHLTQWQLTNGPNSEQDNTLVIYCKGLEQNQLTHKTIIIDANRISLSKQANLSSSMLNHLPSQVTDINIIDIQHLQHLVLVSLDINGQTLLAEISQLSLEKMNLAVGDDVFVQFKAV
ncbi:ATP-binding cassette domain-containing protein [uncultured Psychrosphaera sp.]|uniref:ATP-binding cassette domain-containing protein n=1 Tax=uncultured Psychrosphaera sp. TaxID=1403522 RepID=UPI0030FAE27C